MADAIYAGDGGAFKACTKCGVVKSISSYHANRDGLLGRSSVCCECKNRQSRTSYSIASSEINSRRRAARDADIDRVRDYYRDKAAARRREKGCAVVGDEMTCERCGDMCRRNGPSQKYCDECAAKSHEENVRRWSKENAEIENDRKRRSRAENPERHAEYVKKWRENNKDKVKESYSRRMKDPKRRLDKNISGSVRRNLRGLKGGRKWESLVGYTIEDLRSHLERHFSPGMSWDNYGNGGWEVDHTIPKSAFNYSSPHHLDFKRAWALDNLMPMWASDNRKKNDKLKGGFQPSLRLEDNSVV